MVVIEVYCNETNENTKIDNFYSSTAKDNDDCRFEDSSSLSAILGLQ